MNNTVIDDHLLDQRDDLKMLARALSDEAAKIDLVLSMKRPDDCQAKQELSSRSAALLCRFKTDWKAQ